ncbi:MAG TPA: GspH/FimT family pseudopilin [Vicinamibacterales bacterium]|nr:GspH/FimT family pseudopilin [Vicinamibacterales bacterium]
MRADRAQLPARGPRGFTLIDLVFSCAALFVMCAVAIPQTLSTIEHARGFAAARYLASRMALARGQAVSRSTTIALRFVASPSGVSIAVFQDGNGNGVRARDIDLQIDRLIDAPVMLSQLFPGVEFGLMPQTPGSDPIQLGGSNLLSFTAHGTASSGSLYIRGRDGTQWMVRVLGATGRTRVLRYSPASSEWVYGS